MDFNYISDAYRYPGGYIEIDGSQAGLGSMLPGVLIVGQKLATGTAAAGEIIQVAGVNDAKIKAGEGSMLAQMVAKYRATDPTFDIYILPYADNPAGVQATGSIAVTAAPTAAGVLSLYIAQRLVSVGIGVGMTADQIAAAIAQAITAAGIDIPVTASVLAHTVTLTARHKGTCGNSIDLSLNLYGETSPEGLGITLTAMTGGAGDPAPGDLPSIIGTDWYRYVALGINDDATMAAWHAETRRRYQPPMQHGSRVFAAFRGDYLAAVAYGSDKNAEHMVTLALEHSPFTTWEGAAVLAAVAAPRLNNNPVKSLEGAFLPGLKATSYFDWTDANSLLFKGMSVMEVGRDGSCYIKRLISMYRFRPDGSNDDAYLDINTAEAMERIREVQITGANQRFSGTVASKTDEGYRPGLDITTEDGVRAYLLSLYKNNLMRERGWVQAYDYYKNNLVVQQDPNNPSRFNFRDKPVVNSPYYILAGRSQFLKAVPSY